MPLPQARELDSTVALLADAYGYIGRQCRELGTDAFKARLMLRPVVLMQGAEAAEIFYGGDRFSRSGAMPQSTMRLLQDKGSVQQLEDQPHRHRKAMFMAMMTPEAIAGFCSRFEALFRSAAEAWQRESRVVFFDAIRPVLCKAACDWAGTPVDGEDLRRRTAEMAAMVDYAGSYGPGLVNALRLRRRSEKWARAAVEDARGGDRLAPPGSALDLIASHRDENGELLDPEVAAVELLNVIRPAVAIDRFILFSALALHRRPDLRTALADAPDDVVERFVQEVRRHSPFFPLIGGTVRHRFRWRDHDFEAGDWVILGLHATNHDPSIWPDPEAFRPERFETWDGGAYDFVPQGGGDFLAAHRCPGEWLTIATMKTAARILARDLDYTVPDQDLGIAPSSLPALPASRFVIEDVRLRAAAART